MKRIIAYTFLGLLIYAGGFLIYYAAVDLRINTAVAKDLTHLDTGNLRAWTVVEGSVHQVMKEFKTETTQPTLFGFPYGKPIEKHYYLLPMGETRIFMLLLASDEHDLEIIEQLKTDMPHERAEGDATLEIRGVVEEMSLTMFQDLKYYLMKYNDLLGARTGLMPTDEVETSRHIIPYVIQIRHTHGNEHIPLIIGIAMCLVGIGLAVLLTVKIKLDKDSY